MSDTTSGIAAAIRGDIEDRAHRTAPAELDQVRAAIANLAAVTEDNARELARIRRRIPRTSTIAWGVFFGLLLWVLVPAMIVALWYAFGAYAAKRWLETERQRMTAPAPTVQP